MAMLLINIMYSFQFKWSKTICTYKSAYNIPHICIAEPNKAVTIFFECSLALYSDVADRLLIMY